MKNLLRLLIIPVAALTAAEATSEEDSVREFYAAYQKLNFSGLPDKTQAKTLSPYLSSGLQALLRIASNEQARCMRAFKDEKPPWIEGDLFSSNFEGLTFIESVSAPAGESKFGQRTLLVTFAYMENGHTVRWTDGIVIVPSERPGKWVVDDILYRGGQEFSSGFGANLRSSLGSRGCGD